MVATFFSALIAVTAILFIIYSIFYERKSAWIILALAGFAAICLYCWLAAVLILPAFLFYKRLDFGSFAALNMFAAVLLSYFFLNLFLAVQGPFIFAVLSAAIIICVLAIFGIFEDGLKKFLLISNAAQTVFVVLDLGIAKIIGELSILGTVQIFNYTIAGLTLFLTLGVLAKGKTKISELEGSVFFSKWNDAFATIACLSLAGLPAFNMFISEWVSLTYGFFVHPMITVFVVFIALLLFIMYYKLVYVLLVGEGEPKNIPRPLTLINGVLAACCILLGVLPSLQHYILSGVG